MACGLHVMIWTTPGWRTAVLTGKTVGRMNKRRELFFDTNCLLDIYHGRDRIKPYFDDVMAGGLRPYLSVISEAELWRGLRAGEVTKHEALLSQFVL
ncbi:MAG: type II toxin-antitoxin system VapC family toxin, partial [Anaerolineae bacterium]|nr:type II toxin-antitoxin system VapC family toxin [Anaerolineae bacterium]